MSIDYHCFDTISCKCRVCELESKLSQSEERVKELGNNLEKATKAFGVMDRELIKTSAQLESARKVLEFYADKENWFKTILEDIGGVEYERLAITDDRGEKARRAIATLAPKEK